MAAIFQSLVLCDADYCINIFAITKLSNIGVFAIAAKGDAMKETKASVAKILEVTSVSPQN